MEALPVQRPGSLRSMHSNSSIGSGVSLTRRPRTIRARSKTFNGGGTRPEEDVPQLPSAPSDLPYLSGPVVQEPLEDHSISSQEPLNSPPVRPPRSPQRLEAEIRSSDTASSQQATDADPTFVEPVALPQVSVPAKPSKATRHASSLPHLDTGYRPPPSAFQRDPALTPVNNLRDSVSTQQSGVSSSLYPPSTSTASGPESPPSPQSIINQAEVAPFDVEVNEVQEYDGDDVAYRLRLLVKNNYFLPPAHSKPSPADFAPSPVDPSRKSPRPPGPAFLDLFRVGKSKSKPPTPPGPGSPYDPTKPMLRTTSDTISPPYGHNSNQPRSSSQGPHPALLSPLPALRGRVVVVREKMNDIAIAAKQAEQDLKIRGARLEQSSQQGNSASVDDVIDPTDAVDVPLPSPSYPFAIQASGVHGLGVLESVGANVLAERLIPSKSPNISSTYDAAEDSWRKALLHQAVHHSLDNTPDVSSFSHIIDASTPVGSPRATTVDIRTDTPTATQTLLQQKIAVRSSADVSTPKATKHSRQNSAGSVPKNGTRGKLAVIPDNRVHDSSRPSSYLPQRVDTPSGPMTPLGPPPRRFITAQHSHSQTDLTTGHLIDSLDHDDEHRRRHILRRTASSPLLAEGYRSSASRDDFSSPPPIPSYLRDSQATVTSFGMNHDDYRNSDMHSETHESDVDDVPRMSLALSAMQSRPSLSEYSQASLSPTTSNFQEMLNHDTHSSSSVAGPSRFSVEQHLYRSNPSARSSAMSPPPRISSSLAHVALPPPPRSSSLQYQSTSMHVQSFASSAENEESNSGSGEPTFQINAPDPTTPPFPLSPEREHFGPLSEDSHPTSSSIEIDPAHGPSAVTSFFDSIQSQPNAMDDLESSSDESDDDEPQPIQPKLFVDPRTRAISSASASATTPRPQIMKHGNLSTPYIRHNLLPIGHDARSKQPIANSPPLLSKNDAQTSSYDFFRYAQENPLNFSALAGAADNIRRPSSADPVTAWRNTQRAQESLRKLDGMLIQHMEDEKDTIKRIATQLKQIGDSTPV